MTIKSIYKRFPSQQACIKLLEEVLWVNGPICPYCKSCNYSEVENENRYHCNTCNTTFSVTVGTIFHKTKCDLQKWFYSFHDISMNKGITIRELAKRLEVTNNTAMNILKKIKKAKLTDTQLIDTVLNRLNKDK